jgi:hypothetical protein
MRFVGRKLAVVAALAVGALVAGCGSESCNITPEVRPDQAPTSCTLRADTDVTVLVGWCDCGAPATCQVTTDGGAVVLEPRVDSCDASCPANPSGCPLDPVPCHLNLPAGNYDLHIISGLDFLPADLSVTSGGGSSCGPT